MGKKLVFQSCSFVFSFANYVVFTMYNLRLLWSEIVHHYNGWDTPDLRVWERSTWHCPVMSEPQAREITCPILYVLCCGAAREFSVYESSTVNWQSIWCQLTVDSCQISVNESSTVNWQSTGCQFHGHSFSRLHFKWLRHTNCVFEHLLTSLRYNTSCTNINNYFSAASRTSTGYQLNIGTEDLSCILISIPGVNS